jgi:hypothetical protein
LRANPGGRAPPDARCDRARFPREAFDGPQEWRPGATAAAVVDNRGAAAADHRAKKNIHNCTFGCAPRAALHENGVRFDRRTPS